MIETNCSRAFVRRLDDNEVGDLTFSVIIEHDGGIRSSQRALEVLVDGKPAVGGILDFRANIYVRRAPVDDFDR